MLQVGVFAIKSSGVAHQHAIDNKRETDFGITRPVHAANIDLCIRDLRRIDNRYAGRQFDEILSPADAGTFYVLFGQHGNRGRNVLQRFLDPARCNDDLFNIVGTVLLCQNGHRVKAESGKQ